MKSAKKATKKTSGRAIRTAANKRKKFYVTTPIYYVNDKPHIGHAYTTIAADVLARWHRMMGKKVFFLTGTDEHGQKVEKKAQAMAMAPKAFVDKIVEDYKKAWKVLNISYDHFIRTSDAEHEKVVKKIFEKLKASGDVYRGTYEGWYCVPDESFWTDMQLKDGKCPDCGREVIRMKEDAYFFRLSKYQDKVLEWIEKSPNCIMPQSRRNEVIAFIKRGLNDICITRKTVKWGIPVPGDPSFTIYVWLDALPNYISALGWPSDKKFKTFWPADVHIIGKEILRFHAIIWPAILFALGAEPPQMVFAHGWWTVNGEKMSKSRGNIVDPIETSEKYGADVLRYFLMREITFGEDGDFSEQALITRNNTELADELGNLLNRVLILTEKFYSGDVPKAKVNQSIADLAEKVKLKASAALDNLQFSVALEEIWKLIQHANKYINDSKPWDAPENVRAEVIYNSLETMRIVASFLYPFMPETADKIVKQLGFKDYEFAADKLKFGLLKAGQKINRSDILFKKFEQKPIAQKVEKDGLIDILDFKRFDIRIAEIKSAEEIPGSDKLLKLKIDIGGEERQIVAGIKKKYSPAQLKGKKIVVIANLKPAIIRGVKSEGMLLAAGDEPVLLVPDEDIAAGAKVS
jgi:methionyl-tRNA synthetase